MFHYFLFFYTEKIIRRWKESGSLHKNLKKDKLVAYRLLIKCKPVEDGEEGEGASKAKEDRYIFWILVAF